MGLKGCQPFVLGPSFPLGPDPSILTNGAIAPAHPSGVGFCAWGTAARGSTALAVIVRVVDLCALAGGGWEGRKANQLRDLNPPPDATGRRFFLWRGRLKETGLNGRIAAMDGLYFEIWAGGRQSTGRSACATENWAAVFFG